MKRGVKNIFLSLLGFSVAPILTACYGSPYEDFDNPRFNSIEGFVVDESMKPIENIRITDQEYNKSTHTNAEGHFEMQFSESRHKHTIIAEDIDGQANGGEFDIKTATITAENFNNVRIILKAK
jgi:putative lipoprotein (rSAM/lipoprotein system)